MKAFLSAKETADLLGISRATLYAYVSRGLLRSEPVLDDTRERRYRQEDVTLLKRRKEARRDPSQAAAQSLRFGGPILSSGITLIQDGSLFYKGRNALKLAEHTSLEDIATLLWNGSRDLPRRRSSTPASTRRPSREIKLDQIQAVLALGSSTDPAAYDLRTNAVRQTGWRILDILASQVSGKNMDLPMHQALQQTWAKKDNSAGEIIRAALVLCADHELNISAFTARCVASAGASPYDVIVAAMAALKGQRHGGQSESAAALLAALQSGRDLRRVLAERLRRGERIPGFGHPLYPDGDPRAKFLLDLLYGQHDSVAVHSVKSISQAGTKVLGEYPNLDFALAAISHCFGFPKGAPLCIFALGRTVGWIAHAMEQYESGDFIRPRAQYNGPAAEV
jgi:citrate synthase